MLLNIDIFHSLKWPCINDHCSATSTITEAHDKKSTKKIITMIKR